MHRIFQAYIDRLSESVDVTDVRDALADAAAAFELHRFTYLSMTGGSVKDAQFISTYPPDWVDHYVANHYERLDPVIMRALSGSEPFEWGLEVGPTELTKRQQQFFDEAAAFGIRCGFTIPIHNAHGPVAAVTFASEERYPAFRRSIELNTQALQLVALYFHAHARLKLAPDRVVDGVSLSPREFECLVWAAEGKSAWEIGLILGISRRTAVFHLENAKAKLGVRSIKQAVARLAASTRTMP